MIRHGRSNTVFSYFLIFYSRHMTPASDKLFFLTTAHQFVNTAKDQLEVLEGMYKKMTTMFQDTAKYFAFDPKKYTMEEFFSDLKAFIENFNVCIICIFFFKKSTYLF